MQSVLYVGMVALGVAFFYSLMVVLAATKRLARTRTRDSTSSWFYITSFAR